MLAERAPSAWLASQTIQRAASTVAASSENVWVQARSSIVRAAERRLVRDDDVGRPRCGRSRRAGRGARGWRRRRWPWARVSCRWRAAGRRPRRAGGGGLHLRAGPARSRAGDPRPRHGTTTGGPAHPAGRPVIGVPKGRVTVTAPVRGPPRRLGGAATAGPGASAGAGAERGSCRAPRARTSHTGRAPGSVPRSGLPPGPELRRPTPAPRRRTSRSASPPDGTPS